MVKKNNTYLGSGSTHFNLCTLQRWTDLSEFQPSLDYVVSSSLAIWKQTDSVSKLEVGRELEKWFSNQEHLLFFQGTRI